MNIITKRVIGFGIDLIITAFIGIIIGFILVDTSIITNELAGLLTFIILLIRDLYNKDGSIGKKIMKIKLVNRKNVLFKILRNITTVLWPLEGIILLIFKKRLGDIIFQTSVVDANHIEN